MGQNPAETGKTALPRSVMRGVWGSRGGAGGVNTIESGPPAAQSGPWRRPSASGSRGRGGSAAARPWSCQRSRPATGAGMGGRYPAPPEAPGNPQEPLRAWRRHPRCPRHLAGAGPGGCPPRRRRNPTSAVSAAKPSGRGRTWCGTAASTPARSPTSAAPAPRASPRTPTSGSTSAPTPARSPTSAAPAASASAGAPTSPSTSASTAARNPSRAASVANASVKAPACSNMSAATPARSPTAAPTAPRTSAGAPTSCPTTAASTPPNGGPAQPWRCPRGSEGSPRRRAEVVEQTTVLPW
ncbi:uncharacterized protein LOC141917199 isoform X1 [Strix aluco]|uniref:uncharacterized protein LOC141917199 isoform X1 n=1 Tax=Strix aluco TaxID=111821 RepID=UPI003DA324FC